MRSRRRIVEERMDNRQVLFVKRPDGAVTPDAAGRRDVAVGAAGAGRNIRGARRGFRAMRAPG